MLGELLVKPQPRAGVGTWGDVGLPPRPWQHLLLSTQPVLAVDYPDFFPRIKVGWLVVKIDLARGVLCGRRGKGWIRGMAQCHAEPDEKLSFQRAPLYCSQLVCFGSSFVVFLC